MKGGGNVTEETTNEWIERMEKAATNIGKCLDGLTVSEADYVLDRVKERFLDRAVVRVSVGQVTES